MFPKYLLIFDLLTTLAVILQAQDNIFDRKSRTFTDYSSLTNDNARAFHYPEFVSTMNRPICEFPCGKKNPEEREKQYVAYYDSSQVILPSHANFYLPTFRNANYKPQDSRKNQTHRLKSMETFLQRNVMHNARTLAPNKKSLKNHQTENPGWYLKPAKIENQAYSLHDNKKAKPIVEESPHSHGNANKIHNHRLTYEEGNEKEQLTHVYVRDHAPDEKVQDNSTTEASNISKKQSKSEDKRNSLALSHDGQRVDFQIQGHDGPKSYIFGFDTGDGKNRQYRLEEKLKNGTVKGHYGFYDAKGKLQIIRYLARPHEGYEERHHESNARKPEV